MKRNVKCEEGGFVSFHVKRNKCLLLFSLCSFPFVVYCHQPNTVSNFESLSYIFLLNVSTLNIEPRDWNIKTVFGDDISSFYDFFTPFFLSSLLLLPSFFIEIKNKYKYFKLQYIHTSLSRMLSLAASSTFYFTILLTS